MAFAENTLDGASPQASVAAAEITPVEAIPPAGKITLASQETYRHNAELVRRHSVRQRSPSPDEPTDVTILESVEDLMARTDISPASQKAYRSAMLWLLSDRQDQSHDNRLAFAKLQTWRPASNAAIGIIRPANSGPDARGARKISEAHYRQIVDELTEMSIKSEWARRTTVWVQATICSGARPIEWLDATWGSPDQSILAIRTAKEKVDEPRFLTRGAAGAAGSSHVDADTDDDVLGATPLRVEGALREISIQRGFDRMVIRDHMRELEQFLAAERAETDDQRLEAFRRYHHQCRTLLRRVVLKLWKGAKAYTLYTMRSQFQANQRASVLDPAEVRKMMGHTTDVSGSHYGRANQAFSRFKPEKAASEPGSKEAAQAAETEQSGNREVESL